MVSDYGEQRKAAVRARNAKNKQRGRDMEIRIAKYLSGNRVPMSGSGSIKGDGQVFCDHGYLFVECKHSAVVDVCGVPRIRIPFNWLSKMELQAGYMKAALAVLVFHFHAARMQDYALVSEKDFKRIAIEDNHAITETVDKHGRRGWHITQKFLESALVKYNSLIRMECNEGVFFVMRLAYFRQLVHKEVCE